MPETLYGKELNKADPLLSLLDEAVWLLGQSQPDPSRLVIPESEVLTRSAEVLRRWRDERARPVEVAVLEALRDGGGPAADEG